MDEKNKKVGWMRSKIKMNCIRWSSWIRLNLFDEKDDSKCIK